MKTPLLLSAIAVLLGISACNTKDTTTCSDLSSFAAFSVNGTALDVTHTPVWTSDGIYQSLGFRHDLPNGEQHIVTIIFEGDTTGNYPLKGTLDPHRGMYMGPASGGSPEFTGTGQTGTLTVSDIDLDKGCLIGSYQFTANTTEVSGEFEGIRVTD